MTSGRQESFYSRSDHFNFARKGVPILFFFNGTHPQYHQPDDEVRLIDTSKLARVAQLGFYLGVEIANTDDAAEVESGELPDDRGGAEGAVRNSRKRRRRRNSTDFAHATWASTPFLLRSQFLQPLHRAPQVRNHDAAAHDQSHAEDFQEFLARDALLVAANDVIRHHSRRSAARRLDTRPSISLDLVPRAPGS